MRLFICALFLATAIGSFGLADAMAANGEEAWRKVESSVNDIVQARQREGFSAEDARSGAQQRRMEKLLDQAVEILSDGQADGGAERARLRQIQERISGIRQKIAEARFSMASAPDTVSNPLTNMIGSAAMNLGISLGQPNKETWRSRISSLEEDIRGLESEQSEIKKQFAVRLSGLGVNLTANQVEGLMAMATAEDFLAMQATFENMKAINQVLMDATVRSDESLEVAKRYYGIYSVMLEIALHMHDEFIERVDGEYLLKLDGIEKRIKTERDRTRTLLTSEKDTVLRATLERNAKAQALTLKTSELYRDRLKEQRDRIATSRRKILSQHAVAVNTWNTVDQSAALVAMMRTTGKNFEALMNLDIPPLRPFESIEMQNELEKLTNELKPMS